MQARKNGRTASTCWAYMMPLGRALSTISEGRSGKSRDFAPIVWSNQRELLTLVQRFRAATALGAEDAYRRHRHTAGQSSGDPVEDVRAAREALWYTHSLALADAYIERLERAIDERPQGKGGWQVVSQLEKMYAEFAAHHDNPPAGMAIEVEPRTMPAAESIVSETLFSKD